jgi:hypothetical protein
MLSPSRHPLCPLDPNAVQPSPAPDRKHEHASAKHRPDDADDCDLRRLESSIQWLKREAMIARLETEPPAQKENLRLPRAGQLPPVSGIRSLDIEGSSHRREALTLQLTAPLPHEHLQLPPPWREHRHNLRAGLYVLIAGGIVGLIAYQSVGGWVPELAQAAHLQAQRWQICQGRCDSTFMNRNPRGHGVGLWF